MHRSFHQCIKKDIDISFALWKNIHLSCRQHALSHKIANLLKYYRFYKPGNSQITLERFDRMPFLDHFSLVQIFTHWLWKFLWSPPPSAIFHPSRSTHLKRCVSGPSGKWPLSFTKAKTRQVRSKKMIFSILRNFCVPLTYLHRLRINDNRLVAEQLIGPAQHCRWFVSFLRLRL